MMVSDNVDIPFYICFSATLVFNCGHWFGTLTILDLRFSQPPNVPTSAQTCPTLLNSAGRRSIRLMRRNEEAASTWIRENFVRYWPCNRPRRSLKFRYISRPIFQPATSGMNGNVAGFIKSAFVVKKWYWSICRNRKALLLPTRIEIP